jgi:hypothetical protein
MRRRCLWEKTTHDGAENQKIKGAGIPSLEEIKSCFTTQILR